MFVIRGRVLLNIKVAFAYQQKANLVNIKLKWVKDRALDLVVSREKDVRAVSLLVSIIYSEPQQCLPIDHLSRRRHQLGLPEDLKLSTFIRKYPTVFHKFPVITRGGTTPWFQLTDEVLNLHKEELDILQKNKMDLVERLQKLLMLARDVTLPLQTLQQLKWDMGLPNDYEHSLIPHYPKVFKFTRLRDDRVGLKLLHWDDRLAISQLQQKEVDSKGYEAQSLAFPIGFTRGFGLKRKCMKWLEEWQNLPYTSPYADASHLDSRTDVSEKRIVGVFHELLNLTIRKKTDRKNLSNLRRPLDLPQKFTKVFARHPGIFYISQKCATQTVILRDAYDRRELISKHPLVEIREKYFNMMKTGMLNRKRGLYRTEISGEYKEDYRIPENPGNNTSDRFDEDTGWISDCNLLSDDDLIAALRDPC